MQATDMTTALRVRVEDGGPCRKIADRRVYPAVDIFKSGTRKEDLLLDPKDLAKIWVLRKYLSDYNPTEAMEFLIDKLSKTKDNQQFLGAMNA